MGRKIILNGKEYIGGGEDVSGIVDSLNTTEQTPRNIADVLAEELARIAENILPPNAEDIAYDNTASGLTATNVQDAIDEVISSQSEVIADTMADLTENKTATVTDGVADFETIDGSLVKSLIVEIEPSQSGSGTPSPSNIRPISGYTQKDVTVVGKNEFSATINSGHTINASGAYITSSDRSATEDFIPIKPNTVYTVSYVNSANEYCGVHFYDRNKNYLSLLSWGESPRTFTSVADAYYVRFSFRTNTEITNAQLELGSSATAYEPYKGKTYTTAFGQTVYGGTLDVLTGKLTITHGYVDLGTLNWMHHSSGNFYVEVASINYAISAVGICSQYEQAPPIAGVALLTQDKHFASLNNAQRLVIKDTTYSDAPTFKSAMNGVQLVYELETPTVIQLTPQTVKALVGENHISASTGDVTECKYSMLINGDDLEMLLS